MDNIQKEMLNDFMNHMNVTMKVYAELLLKAAKLHDDILCESMVDSSEEKIANLKLIRKAIIDMTESAQLLIKISSIEDKLT
jgi:hypothetical protein